LRFGFFCDSDFGFASRLFVSFGGLNSRWRWWCYKILILGCVGCWGSRVFVGDGLVFGGDGFGFAWFLVRGNPLYPIENIVFSKKIVIFVIFVNFWVAGIWCYP
jgi:hypothetical protein